MDQDLFNLFYQDPFDSSSAQVSIFSIIFITKLFILSDVFIDRFNENNVTGQDLFNLLFLGDE